MTSRATTTAASRHKSVVKSLYRSLLRAVIPFTKPSPDAVQLNCLLSDTGNAEFSAEAWAELVDNSDEHWKLTEGFPSDSEENVNVDESPRAIEADRVERELDMNPPLFPNVEQLLEQARHKRGGSCERLLAQDLNLEHVLFRKLLRRVMHHPDQDPTDFGRRQQFRFPHQVHGREYGTGRLRAVIRREFRKTRNQCAGGLFSDAVRRRVAFWALRVLNEKTQWHQELKQQQQNQSSDQSFPLHPQQAALHVQPITRPSYARADRIRPGTFLVAHPLLKGYFRRSVVCLFEGLSRLDDTRNNVSAYGVVVNRWVHTGPTTTTTTTLPLDRNNSNVMTLSDVFTNLPQEFGQVFGGVPVRDGGPVHRTLQMVHHAVDEKKRNKLDGTELGRTLLPKKNGKKRRMSSDIEFLTTRSTFEGTPKPDLDPRDSRYKEEEKEYMYVIKGNLEQAVEAVNKGRLGLDRFQFFAGACTWSPAQLEDEIASGVWMLCSGSPDIMFSGTCQHPPAPTTTLPNQQPPPREDLWLSMLSACGTDEAKFAHLMLHDDGHHPYSRDCDDFDH